MSIFFKNHIFTKNIQLYFKKSRFLIADFEVTHFRKEIAYIKGAFGIAIS
jgi:hypothetical protein